MVRLRNLGCSLSCVRRNPSFFAIGLAPGLIAFPPDRAPEPAMEGRVAEAGRVARRSSKLFERTGVE